MEVMMGQYDPTHTKVVSLLFSPLLQRKELKTSAMLAHLAHSAHSVWNL